MFITRPEKVLPCWEKSLWFPLSNTFLITSIFGQFPRKIRSRFIQKKLEMYPEFAIRDVRKISKDQINGAQKKSKDSWCILGLSFVNFELILQVEGH